MWIRFRIRIYFGRLDSVPAPAEDNYLKSVLRIRIQIRIRIGSGFKSAPGSGSGSGFGIRIRIQQGNFSCLEAYKSHKIL